MARMMTKVTMAATMLMALVVTSTVRCKARVEERRMFNQKLLHFLLQAHLSAALSFLPPPSHRTTIKYFLRKLVAELCAAIVFVVVLTIASYTLADNLIKASTAKKCGAERLNETGDSKCSATM